MSGRLALASVPSRTAAAIPAALLTALLAVLAPGQGTAQEAEPLQIAVEGPRPLALALETLAARHSLLISYEDPVYTFPGDLADVTEKVRRDLDRYTKGAAPRVLVPASGRVAMRYAMGKRGVLDHPEAVVQALLDDHAARGNPCRFQLIQEADRFFVVPAEVRTARGEWVPARSVLETEITLPAQPRSGPELLQALVTKVGQAAKSQVVLGMVPVQPLLRAKLTLGSTSEPARQVLVRALAIIEATAHRRLAWQLFYDPGLRLHVLNLHFQGSGEPGAAPDPAR